jgi:uncharacterized protein (DUF924 family)
MTAEQEKAKAEEILGFWFNEVGPKGWYEPEAGLDDIVRSRFETTWTAASAAATHPWICAPRSSLALVVLLDQFPRNMFRGKAQAFVTDRRALSLAKMAIDRGHDRRVPMPERHFFYLPFMHAEIGSEQHRSVRLFRLCPGAKEYLPHAIAHRWVIRKFGRFPYRNAALGRENTPEEREFLEAGGYAAALKAVAA